MKYKLIYMFIVLAVVSACNSNGSANKIENLLETDSSIKAKSDQFKRVDSLETIKTQALYNFMDKIPGTYSRVSDANNEFIPRKVTIKFSGKKLIVENEKYSYDVVYEKKDTILRFSSVSEESGDFLGGGNIIINGNKVLYKMFFGPTAEEEYIFSKK